jgi:hypothetical protein
MKAADPKDAPTVPFEPCNYPERQVQQDGRNHWFYCACPARKFWVVVDDEIAVTILYARCDKHMDSLNLNPQDGAMEISREVYGVYVVMDA